MRCHTVRRCSGISRYVTDPIWKCEQHGGRKRPQRVVEGAETKPKCASSSCKSALKKNVNGNYSCITCESCNKKFHKKCTKLSREVQEKVIEGENSWTCQKCELTLIAICSQEDPIPSIQEAVREKWNKMKIIKRDYLRILQWNCDTLSTRVGELKMRAAKLDLDVILIQETKMKAKDKTPNILGYKVAMRQDRVAIDGGGLLCLIKPTLRSCSQEH